MQPPLSGTQTAIDSGAPNATQEQLKTISDEMKRTLVAMVAADALELHQLIELD